MVNDWSGAIIYEWIQETNNYGLISYGAPAGTATGSGVVAGYTRTGTPTPVSPDFSNLRTQWATLTPTGMMKSDMTTGTLSTRSCPASSSGTQAWLVDGNTPLPTVGETLYSGGYATAKPTGSDAGSTASGSSASSSSTSSSKSLARPKSSMTKMGASMVGVSLVIAMWL